MSSQLEHVERPINYKTHLQEPQHALMSAVATGVNLLLVDVFDTLLERTIKPEHTKILASDKLGLLAGLPEHIDGPQLYKFRQKIERQLGQRNLVETGEGEFSLNDVSLVLFEKLTELNALPVAMTKAQFGDLVLRAELIAEGQSLRAKAGAIDALMSARKTGQRVFLVSDFYLPNEALASLLTQCGIGPDLYQILVVSCDRKASKRSGKLYDLLIAEHNIVPEKTIMVGDNLHSDIAMAKARGLGTQLVSDFEQVQFYESHEARVDRIGRLQIAVSQLMANGAPQSHLRQIAPALVLFCERLYRRARSEKLEHLFFLSREGKMMKALFDHYQDVFGFVGPERITTHYFYVSRRACFMPSLHRLETENFEKLFRQYHSISLRDFAQNCGISDDLTESICNRLGLNIDKVEADFPKSNSFAAFRADAQFAADYEMRRNDQKTLFNEYLISFGVDFAKHTLAVVDCGWKGTMQDHIVDAVTPEIKVKGFYIGLLSVGQPVADKAGLLFSNAGKISEDFTVFAENTSVFEIVLCADHGSVIRYELNAVGKVTPVLKSDPEEQAFINSFAMPVAQDLFQACSKVMTAKGKSVVAQNDWLRFVADTHSQLVYKPWEPSAQWLMTATHKESFGVFHTSKVGALKTLTFWDRLMFLQRTLRNPRYATHGSFWPALNIYTHLGKSAVRAYALARKISLRKTERTKGIQ